MRETESKGREGDGSKSHSPLRRVGKDRECLSYVNSPPCYVFLDIRSYVIFVIFCCGSDGTRTEPPKNQPQCSGRRDGSVTVTAITMQ